MTFPDDADHAAAAAPFKRQWSPLPWAALAALVGLVGWFWRTVETQNLDLGGLGAHKTGSGKTASSGQEVVTTPPEDAKPDISLYMVSHETARKAPAPKPAAAVTEWRLRGRVFDLATLAPIDGVKLTFSDPETDKRFETMSDAAGRYRTIVPPLARRGYNARVSRAGYAPTYLDPGVQDVPALPETARRALCAKLASAVEPPASLRPRGAAPLVTDFYLAPK